MVDLTKFSKDDLKKTAAEINTYLKKAEEKDFDPNESTPDAAHLEDKLGGTSKKIEDKGTETKKADFPPEAPAPNGDGSEEMTAPSQGDAMSQILALLQEILSKIGAPAAPPMPPAPTDQIQQSAAAPAPVATPSTSSPSKSDININVTKAQVEEILKGMGLTPSQVTAKPKVDSGHPIEKGASVTFKDISKMSWEELNVLDSQKSNGAHY